jgi:hypothetical protein
MTIKPIPIQPCKGSLNSSVANLLVLIFVVIALVYTEI